LSARATRGTLDPRLVAGASGGDIVQKKEVLVHGW